MVAEAEALLELMMQDGATGPAMQTHSSLGPPPPPPPPPPTVAAAADATAAADASPALPRRDR
jgi:hypothetical protein